MSPQNEGNTLSPSLACAIRHTRVSFVYIKKKIDKVEDLFFTVRKRTIRKGRLTVNVPLFPVLSLGSDFPHVNEIKCISSLFPLSRIFRRNGLDALHEDCLTFRYQLITNIEL